MECRVAMIVPLEKCSPQIRKFEEFNSEPYFFVALACRESLYLKLFIAESRCD